MKHILKCPKCGEYSIREECPCGGKAVNPKPPKYSPEGRLDGYQREAKEEERKKEGLI